MNLQEGILQSEVIHKLQIFYYSSSDNLFINTVVLEVLNNKFIAQNVKIELHQISQPTHQEYGQAPFICINHTHILKRNHIWDFIMLIIPINSTNKYEFLSIAQLSQFITDASNLFSEYDQNPYFLFISPWKKWKRHKQLQEKKQWFRQNSLFYSSTDDTLNKEYFIYQINLLAKHMTELIKEHATKPQYLKLYKMLIYSLFKHLKIVQKTLYQVASQVKILKEFEIEVQVDLDRIDQKPAQILPARKIPYTNIHLDILKQSIKEPKRVQQFEDHLKAEIEKRNQAIFKSIFSTVMIGLFMWTFN